jgi:hypothetical protein
MRVLFALKVPREGRWTLRLDKPHYTGDQDHIHIEKKGLQGEFSWNEDGSRRHRGKFPPGVKNIKKAKKLAAEYLGVDGRTLSLIAMLPPAIFEIHLGNLPESKGDIVLTPSKESIAQIAVLGATNGMIYVVVLESEG